MASSTALATKSLEDKELDQVIYQDAVLQELRAIRNELTFINEAIRK